MNSKTRSVFEDLCQKAFSRQLLHPSDKRHIDKCVTWNEKIPEHLLPGRFLMRCTSEEREALSRLTSDDTVSYRPNFWASCT